MRLLLLIAVVVPGILSGPDESPRWGWDQHRIVCTLAWDEMSEAARSGVESLLELEAEPTTWADACVWADMLRGQAGYESFGTAHYVNIRPGADGLDVELDCADTYCVVEAISDMRTLLASGSGSGVERLEAVKFLAHFVSDLHQPLHAGYGDDRGGNSVRLEFMEQQTNLHSIWDRRMLEFFGETWDETAARLRDTITDTDRVLWRELEPVVWADESFRLVEAFVYDFDPDEGLADEYIRRGAAIMEQRMQMAAVRLAALLDQLFES